MSRKVRLLLATATIGVVLCAASYWLAWRMGYSIDFRPPLKVDFVPSGLDRNANGVDDLLDIVAGARSQVELRPRYRSDYYGGGYPPDGEGVCTDVIWRALKAAGYDLKQSVDRDIAADTGAYPEVRGTPDPNIDFRWVPNLYVFFSRTGRALTTRIHRWDRENLKEWQPGDIVVFGSDYNHIGIVSDKRRPDGVPLVIHHGWGYPVEDNVLEYWGDRITGHFRVGLEKLQPG